MQIVVLGMHRSGTSMVARLINMMGAYMGAEGEVSGAASDSAKGFWERTDVRELNDAILASMDADWHQVASFSQKSLGTKQQEAFKERARAIVLKLDAHRPWVIKDPRLCLVFPFWHGFLEMPVCVFVYRRPLAVAESLKARNGFPLRFGLALWEKYTLEGLRSSVGIPRIPVSYDDLMAAPVEAVHALCEQLEQSGVRRLECPSTEAILSFRDEDLRHHKASACRENQYLNLDQSKLFETLQTGAAFQSDSVAALSEGALEILNESAASEQKLKAEKLGLEEHLLDVRMSLLERRASTRIRMVQQLESWICLVRDDIQNMAASWQWRTGDAIGRAVERVGLIPDPGVLAPEQAGGAVSAFEAWQHKAKGRYDAQPASVNSRPFGDHLDFPDELTQRVRKKEQIVAEKNAWLNETYHELTQLADWLQELWTSVVGMEQSGRWKVGRRLGRMAELLRLIPRVPLAPPDHARQVASLFVQWRQDVFRYNAILDFDEALLSLQRVRRRVRGLDSQSAREVRHDPALAGAVAHAADSSWTERAVSSQQSAVATRHSEGNNRRGVQPDSSDVLGTAEPGMQHKRHLDYDVIVFPFIEWKFRIQRPQHLSMQMARHGHRVFYISIAFAPVIPSEKFIVVDTPEQDVYVCQLQCPDPFPSVYTDALLEEQKRALVEAVSELCEAFKARPCVLIVHHPFWLPVIEEIQGGLIVYDCMDLHRGFGMASVDTEREEVRLMKAADLVTVSSHRLKEFIGRYTDAVLVRNGAEVSFFSKKPDRLKHDSGRPVAGYYGAISIWFDLDLVIAAAKAYPEWDFVLVGSTDGSDTKEAAKLSNVHFRGEVPYESLPGWLHSFDVCMIPFKINELTLHTNPVKFYEYLSAGKPIVSTALPELMLVSDQLHLATSEEEFIQRLSDAMEESRDESLARKRAEWAQQHTWENRAVELQAAIADHYPKVSVVVLTHNGLEFTKACLQSLERFTNYPGWELILVDNASTDDTPGVLEHYARNRSGVRALLNTQNLGFSGGNNVGIRAAQGDCLVILNNDTYVTEGWLLGMVRALQSDPELGLVGPVTNNIGNEAKIDIDYATMEEMATAAHAYTSAHRREKLRVDKVGFFCVGFRRAILEEVGFLDEDFGVGFFEDDDYCLRVKAAGYTIAILEDVFIHHHLSGSFNSLGADRRQEIFEKSKAVFEKKWGPWEPHEYRNAERD